MNEGMAEAAGHFGTATRGKWQRIVSAAGSELWGHA